MDEKTIAEIRDVANSLKMIAYPWGDRWADSPFAHRPQIMEQRDRLLALIPREETLEEVTEELLKTSRFFEPEMCTRLRAALERRKAGK